MDKIALVKKQVIEAEWADKISQCRESGLTVSEWCRQNSINPKTYYYHLRKIRKEICEQIPVHVMTVAEESHSVKVNIRKFLVVLNLFVKKVLLSVFLGIVNFCLVLIIFVLIFG